MFVVLRERKIESKPFEQSERKKKKKKRSDRFRMMMMMFSSRRRSLARLGNPNFRENERGRGGRKRDVDRSLFRSISFQRGEIFSRRAHTFNHLLAALKRRCVLNNLIALLRKAFEEVRAPRHFFLNSIDDFAFKNTRFVQTYTSRPRLVSHRA